MHYLDPDVQPLNFDVNVYKRLCDHYAGFVVLPLVPLHEFFEKIEIPAFILQVIEHDNSSKALLNRYTGYFFNAKCTFIICRLEDDDMIPKLLVDEYVQDESPEQKEYNKFKFDQIRLCGLPYINLAESDVLPDI